MRRTDREITDLNRIEAILGACEAASFAFGGDPYVIPLSYGFERIDDRFTLYMHGALEGEKIERIKNDPRGAFTAYTNTHVYELASGGSTSFDSVCGKGRYRLLEGEEKHRALSLLMAHYMPGREFVFPQKMVDETAVMALELEQITGKHHD